MRQEKLGCMGDFANGRPGVASKLFFCRSVLGAMECFAREAAPWPALSGACCNAKPLAYFLELFSPAPKLMPRSRQSHSNQ
jgi:hypothetical protein